MRAADSETGFRMLRDCHTRLTFHSRHKVAAAAVNNFAAEAYAGDDNFA